ncbi:phosphoribosyltransferase family protein [Neobacillus sp. SM06]|uniref:phosphoribosyltransferase family protein n=1 Tax=Neobacillus sp. SM06 TaxID=3422492 RepID=UPI003D29BCE6
MRSTQTLTSYKKKYSFPILDLLNIEVEVTDNPFSLPVDELFTMAARINNKRSFLFMSKLIGKHIPIHPNKALLTSALLAVRYYETKMNAEFDGKTIFLAEFLKTNPDFKRDAFIPMAVCPMIIGFAETATALGHAFSDCFTNASYVHTTREELEDQEPVIVFEEEHSHATSHRCYFPLDMIQNDRDIVLVDDELTTGKTALNIIRSIHSRFPRKYYTVAAILDWRTAESKRAFTKLELELGINIHVISLVAGTVHIDSVKEVPDEDEDSQVGSKTAVKIERIAVSQFFPQKRNSPVAKKGKMGTACFIEETGRFGLKTDQVLEITEKVNRAAAYLAEKRSGKRTLCLGTGEFMYLPLAIAAKLGNGIFYQSTTRSPIFVHNEKGYGARYKAAFPNPENDEITNYVYNIPEGFYDEMFVFFEREVPDSELEPFLEQLKNTGVQTIKLVFFSQNEVGAI